MRDRTAPSEHKAKRTPTLVDVAREAGVGTTTVSRVINGGRSVDPNTLARVQAVITRLAYHPSQAARALKSDKTFSIGLIVPTLRDPFFATLASTVQQVTRSKRYVLLVLASEDDPLQETAELSFFRSYRVDGVLVVAPRLQSRRFLAAVSGLSVPIVALDRPLEISSTSVLSDNYEAACKAVQHLIAHDRRRILCLGGDPELYTIKERARGYRDAVRGAGLSPFCSLGADVPSIVTTLKAYFARGRGRPDAIFALNGHACIQAYDFLLDSPLSMPTDVALFGFDDFPLSAILRPAVSVVRQPVDELGTAATKLLLDEIESGSSKPRHIVLQSDLVLRMSCGCDGRSGQVPLP